MLVIKNDKEKSRLTYFPKIFAKKLFLKLQKKFKVFLFFSLIAIPLIIGLSVCFQKIVNRLPNKYKIPINTQINDLYLKEIFNLNSINKIHFIPRNYLLGIISNPKNLSIDINLLNFQKLTNSRNNAIRRGYLVDTDRKYVKANLRYNDKVFPIKIRLKGKHIDHLIGSQWSYRIRLLNKGSLFGMRKFSMHSPKSRNYLGEAIYHSLLKNENLPYLRYKFAKLKINGKDMGIYAIEEHFDKIMIENSKFKESIIISLDESKWWEENHRDFREQKTITEGYQFDRKVRTFNSFDVYNNPNLLNNYKYASKLLINFVEGKINASDAFEIEKLAQYFAINDLTGSYHNMHWNNLRFYFNPITKKLIPAGFDGNANRKISSLNNQKGPLIRAFNDYELYKKYIYFLEKYSSNNYLSKFFNKNYQTFDDYQNQIFKTYPWSSNLEEYKEILNYNRNYIQQSLNPLYPLFSNLLYTNSENLKIKLANRTNFPLIILGLNYENKPITQSFKSFILPHKKSTTFPKESSHTINLTKGIRNINNLDPSKFTIKYSILGSNQTKITRIDNFFIEENKSISKNLLTLNPNVDQFNFLKTIKDNKKIFIKKGEWFIDKPLVIPPKYRLIALPGTKLIMGSNGIIISKSSINFEGNENNPIEIISTKSGKGLVILNADNESELSYVNFKGLSSMSSNNIGISGAITFYESDVKIDNCNFDSNNSEDYLNIIRSNFKITNSNFTNTSSDALDIDFGNGLISNLKFKNAGNDAIDVSGTKMTYENIYIDGAYDKGISVGEKSNVNGFSLDILNSSIGIASKDLSIFKGKDISIKNTNLGFAVFQKKPEFGPAAIKIETIDKSLINNLKFDNVLENIQSTETYLLEDQSSLSVNGYLFSPNSTNTKKSLYD